MCDFYEIIYKRIHLKLIHTFLFGTKHTYKETHQIYSSKVYVRIYKIKVLKFKKVRIPMFLKMISTNVIYVMRFLRIACKLFNM